MPPLFPVTLALYAVACTLYFVAVAQPQLAFAPRAARLFLALGFVTQAVDIGWLCLHGRSPSSEAREAVFFASWAMIAVYLLSTLRTQLQVVAALVLPVAIVLDLAARLAPGEAPRAASALLSLHILCATLGLAVFTLAAGTSIIYLLTDRQLKGHHLGRLGRRGPPLLALDTLNRRAIVLGFPIFTVALLTGTAFFAQRPGHGGLLFFLRPQYLLAIVTWVLFAALLLARTQGVRGRKAAWVTVAGFATALSVLAIYFLRGLREGL